MRSRRRCAPGGTGGAPGGPTHGEGWVQVLAVVRECDAALALPPQRALVRDWEYSRVSEVPARLLPKVAIVGRPNVGKSALFNRVAGQQIAIVYDYPGVTRDRMYTRATWNGREFLVVDTGGISSDADVVAAGSPAPSGGVSADRIPEAIERQAAAAIAEANVVVMVVDGQMGPTAADEEVAKYLRRRGSRTRNCAGAGRRGSHTRQVAGIKLFCLRHHFHALR